ncbi:MAG: thiamine pyrophosphate-binding protein [Hyphomicrobiaceae bacterium]
MSRNLSLGPKWSHEMYEFLRAEGIDLFAWVPDGGHKVPIARSLADQDAISVPLTREDEGVALLAGAHLGQMKGVLLLQSSGVGNCINMLSLTAHGRFPLVMLVTMRGTYGENNPWQIPMGQGARPALEAMGVHCFEVDYPDEVVPTVQAAMLMAHRSDRAVAVLLSQKLIGAKKM